MIIFTSQFHQCGIFLDILSSVGHQIFRPPPHLKECHAEQISDITGRNISQRGVVELLKQSDTRWIVTALFHQTNLSCQNVSSLHGQKKPLCFFRVSMSGRCTREFVYCKYPLATLGTV